MNERPVRSPRPGRHVHAAARWVLVALPALALAHPAAGQGKTKSPTAAAWRQDTYTLGEPAAMEQAGYVSFGPFPFGDGHSTTDIEHVLGDEVKMRWVETAHFKIGSSLAAIKAPQDRKERRKLNAELAELRDKLPRVRKRQKTLDPWLRLHLFAHRLEGLYRDLCDRLEVTDADFPGAGQTEPATKPPAAGRMGKGPYLGQPSKYTVLLFAKRSSAGHYMQTFLGRDDGQSLRHNFAQCGSLLFVVSTEEAAGALANDTALHCHVVFAIVRNLVDGYRYYSRQIPAWFPLGLAHWHLRRISERHNVYREAKRFDNQPDMLWNWAPRVRARAQHDHFVKAAEFLQWADTDEKTLVDSMMLWSRVDYLMSLGDKGFRTFLHLMKGPVPAVDPQPTMAEIQALQIEALERAWGLTPESFDRQWKEWVSRHYPRK
ncbi:MAG: hypothetical protein AAF628_10655 [Planctomycetota bacterium]